MSDPWVPINQLRLLTEGQIISLLHQAVKPKWEIHALTSVMCEPDGTDQYFDLTNIPGAYRESFEYTFRISMACVFSLKTGDERYLDVHGCEISMFIDNIYQYERLRFSKPVIDAWRRVATLLNCDFVRSVDPKKPSRVVGLSLVNIDIAVWPEPVSVYMAVMAFLHNKNYLAVGNIAMRPMLTRKMK